MDVSTALESVKNVHTPKDISITLELIKIGKFRYFDIPMDVSTSLQNMKI